MVTVFSIVSFGRNTNHADKIRVQPVPSWVWVQGMPEIQGMQQTQVSSPVCWYTVQVQFLRKGLLCFQPKVEIQPQESPLEVKLPYQSYMLY